MKFLAVAALFLLSASIGCGKKTETYDYHFTIDGVDGGAPGCETGVHTFPSLVAYCAGLQSDSLNNNCALSARQDEFAATCTGTFQEMN
jgi:hypothetical protein